ncbi:MAG: hypothetical protein EOM59_21385 [Clostridia bacterium]|nr:hypothetical protein [Clostridia bacterium]
MKKIIYAALAFCVAVTSFTGCSSIITGSTDSVNVRSLPSGALIKVTNKKGEVVTTGTTPIVLKLKKGSSYFTGEEYKITFELPGYHTSEVNINHSINGWYFGNIIFGGLIIGMLIVDPITGGMWTLEPKDVERVLAEQRADAKIDNEGLFVMLKKDLPEGFESALIPLN